jgi:hypothetical protein
MFMHTMAIVGVVLVTLFILMAVVAAIMLLPDFMRYVKIRSL